MGLLRCVFLFFLPPITDRVRARLHHWSNRIQFRYRRSAGACIRFTLLSKIIKQPSILVLPPCATLISQPYPPPHHHLETQMALGPSEPHLIAPETYAVSLCTLIMHRGLVRSGKWVKVMVWTRPTPTGILIGELTSFVKCMLSPLQCFFWLV